MAREIISIESSKDDINLVKALTTRMEETLEQTRTWESLSKLKKWTLEIIKAIRM